MNAIELLQNIFRANLSFVEMTLADFTDAELLQAPAAESNHAMYQLGHSVVYESWMLQKIDPTYAAGDAGFDAKFGADARQATDPSHFPTKDQLLAHLKKVREASIASIGKLTDADLDKPSPVEGASSLGTALSGIVDHMTMHIGQVQVLRRKLGKKVLF